MTTAIRPANQDEINDIVWKACDSFRGVMSSDQYKDYILTFLFLKFLSDLVKERREELEKQFPGKPEMVHRRLERERFLLPAGCDFDSLYAARDADNLGERIDQALWDIEDANKAKLEGVLHTVSFNDEKRLGETKDRNGRLKHLLQDFHDPRLDLRPSRIGNLDVIGNCYEYLISRFASESGKKGGEFFTPPEVSELIARLVAPKPGDRICDPSCGSGSLLIKVAKEVRDAKGNPSDDFSLYGQEVNSGTYALCRMNLFLHGIDSARIEWGDTIKNPKLVEDDRLIQFDVVVANPPFSLDKWGAENASNDPFGRFQRGIPPKSKGDYAFLLHMVETAKAGSGRVGVVVPHGVLFRGASEGLIRKKLIEENLLDAVIGLPANLFFGTGIPAAILLFNKGRKHTDVLFIDAKEGFAQGTNQNKLRADDLAKIVESYRTYETVDRYAYRATREELKENDYNLNIPRYVDTFEEEAPVDLKAVEKRIGELEGTLAAVREEMKGYLRELGV
ncbi:MAG: type I restriction-modification system subunit M [Verrucomicrobiales bacterium]|nr:type I restriction-modification system subunit M [Verrucomicrobiales bacterium]